MQLAKIVTVVQTDGSIRFELTGLDPSLVGKEVIINIETKPDVYVTGLDSKQEWASKG